jgi:hypothetical protein
MVGHPQFEQRCQKGVEKGRLQIYSMGIPHEQMRLSKEDQPFSDLAELADLIGHVASRNINPLANVRLRGYGICRPQRSARLDHLIDMSKCEDNAVERLEYADVRTYEGAVDLGQTPTRCNVAYTEVGLLVVSFN